MHFFLFCAFVGVSKQATAATENAVGAPTKNMKTEPTAPSSDAYAMIPTAVPASATLDLPTAVESCTSEADILKLKVPQLKQLLKARGLAVGGGKVELAARLVSDGFLVSALAAPAAPPPAPISAPAPPLSSPSCAVTSAAAPAAGPTATAPVALPDAGAVSYEWDPTQPSKKTYCCQRAASGRGKCIRCLRTVAAGSLRVGFETYSQSFGPLVRWYHASCFGAFPPHGLAALGGFEGVAWGNNRLAEHDASLMPAVQGLFAPAASGRGEPAVTGAALQGLRADVDAAKAAGCTTQEALRMCLPPHE